MDGYLYWQNEISQARTEARAFCNRFPWLTTLERQDLESHYTDFRVEVARATTRQVAQRCVDLRKEYEARYLQLRLHFFALALTALVVAATGLGILLVCN
ncbi:hypothetical protein ACICHK_41880 (plasmid) [Streptomyces sp. AHU1]|uniref:hypothetical protein n=1 Tax=Streptomyces sp. AHU1 TaxID=3377215 RepID=UPI0038779988